MPRPIKKRAQIFSSVSTLPKNELIFSEKLKEEWSPKIRKELIENSKYSAIFSLKEKADPVEKSNSNQQGEGKEIFSVWEEKIIKWEAQIQEALETPEKLSKDEQNALAKKVREFERKLAKNSKRFLDLCDESLSRQLPTSVDLLKKIVKENSALQKEEEKILDLTALQEKVTLFKETVALLKYFGFKIEKEDTSSIPTPPEKASGWLSSRWIRYGVPAAALLIVTTGIIAYLVNNPSIMNFGNQRKIFSPNEETHELSEQWLSPPPQKALAGCPLPPPQELPPFPPHPCFIPIKFAPMLRSSLDLKYCTDLLKNMTARAPIIRPVGSVGSDRLGTFYANQNPGSWKQRPLQAIIDKAIPSSNQNTLALPEFNIIYTDADKDFTESRFLINEFAESLRKSTNWESYEIDNIPDAKKPSTRIGIATISTALGNNIANVASFIYNRYFLETVGLLTFGGGILTFALSSKPSDKQPPWKQRLRKKKIKKTEINNNATRKIKKKETRTTSQKIQDAKEKAKKRNQIKSGKRYFSQLTEK